MRPVSKIVAGSLSDESPRTVGVRATGRGAVIYRLDTNAWIAYLRQNNARLVQRFLQVVPTDIERNSAAFPG